MNINVYSVRAALKKYYPFISYLVVSSFSLFWFKGRDFINGGDFGWPVNFEVFFKLTTSVWDWSVAPGYNAARQVASVFPYATYGYIAQLLGISSSIFERTVFFFSFFMSGYGFFLLAGKYSKSRLSCFIAGLMYMLSPYASIVVWNPSYGMIFPFYSFLPISMYWLSNYAEDTHVISKSLFKALILTSLSFLGFSYSNPVFFILFVGFSFFTVLSFASNVYLFIKKYCLFTIFYILINFFWIFPVVLSFETQFTGAQNETADLITDSKTRILNSVSLIDGFKEMGLWAFRAGDAGGSYYTFRDVLENPLYTVLALCFVTAAVLAFDHKNRRFFLVYVLLLAGVFLNSGLLLPFPIKNLAGYFYELPFLGRALRSVFLKTGIINTFSMSLLVVFLLDKVRAIKIRMLLYTLLTTIILFRGYPFISGQVIRPGEKNLPSYAFSVPNDYYVMGDYLDEHVKNSYILSLPLPKSYNYVFRWRDDGYIGGDFFRSMSVVKNYYVNMANPVMREFALNYNFSALDRLGVEHVLLRKDASLYFEDRYLTSDFSKLINMLKQQKNIVEEYSTENLTLYKIVRSAPTSLFSVSSDLAYTESYSDEIPIYSRIPGSATTSDELADTRSIFVGPEIIDRTRIDYEEWNKGWAWPQTKVSPSTPLYYVYRMKEFLEGLFLQKDQDKIDYYLWTASKRASELNRYAVYGKIFPRVERDAVNSINKLETRLARYKNSSISWQEYASVTNKVLRYVQRASNLLPTESTTRELFENFRTRLFESSGHYCSGFCYVFRVPKPGYYSLENLNLEDGKFKSKILKENFSDAVSIDDVSRVFLEKDNLLIVSLTEDTLKKKMMSFSDAPNVDDTNIYTSSLFPYLVTTEDELPFSVEPKLVTKYFEITDTEDIYNVIVEFQETGALLALDVMELGDYYRKGDSSATIDDILKNKRNRGIGRVTHEENISNHSIKLGDSLSYVKQFKVSSDTKGIYVKLYIYSLPDESNYTKIDNLSLLSRKVLTPYLNSVDSNFEPKVVNVTYETITPTQYLIDVPRDQLYLVFNAGFDPGWQIKYKDAYLSKFKADGYKNGFRLPDNFQGGRLELRYLPEEGRVLGFYISVFSGVLVFLGLTLTTFYKEKK